MLSLACFLFALISASQTEAKKLIIIGDSISEGYGVRTEEAYPHLLKEMLSASKRDIEIVNAAVSGSLSSSAVSRMRFFLRSPQKPDLFLLQLGGNDGLKATPIKTIEDNLSKAIEFSQSHKVLVILAGMKIFRNFGDRYQKEFESLFPRLSKKYNIPLIPYILEGVGGVGHLNLPDGIHPNPEGHKIIARTVYRYLEPHL